MALPTPTTPADDLKKLARVADHRVQELGLSPIRSQVRDGSVVCPGSDAAVIRIKTDSLPVMSAELAAKVGDATVSEKYHRDDGGLQRRLTFISTRTKAAKAAVAEACRNLACSGAMPLGATDNLNMANPHKPELFWQIKESRARPGRRLAERSTRRSPAAIARSTIKVPAARLTRRPPSRWSASLKNWSTSPRNGSRTKAMPSFCSVNPWTRTIRFSDWAAARICKSSTDKKTGSPPRCDLETAKTLHTTLLGLDSMRPDEERA